MVRYGFLTFIFLFLLEVIFAQTIRINISGIRSEKGIIVISLFESQKQFKSDQPVLIKNISKDSLKDGILIAQFDNLAPAVYGIVVLDDENENGEMDYRLKRPTEGFGFSNYYHKGLFRPKFEDFSFKLEEMDVVVDVVMRYIKEAE